jgi:hypothetical protein
MYHPTLIAGDSSCFFYSQYTQNLLFCYVLANCLEWSNSHFFYSQQPKFCYVSSNADYRRLVVLFLLPVANFFYVLANYLEWSNLRFSYSQQPKFCYVSSNASGVDRRAFSALSSQNLLCISKLPGVKRLALFLLISNAT